MRKAAIGVACVCLVCAGCESSDNTKEESTRIDTPTSISNSVELTRFCDSFLDELAAKAQTCQGGPASAWRPILQGQKPNDLCSRWGRGVDEKRVQFNATNSAGCLTSLRSDLSCDQAVGAMLPSACQSAISGLVAVGESCSASAECAGDTVCDISKACPGVCTALVAVDGDCSAGRKCSLGSSCVAGKCVSKSAQGKACGATVSECEWGLMCKTEVGASTGTCQSRQTSGACTNSEQCAPGYTCSGTDVRACVKAKAIGEECTPGRAECDRYTYCSAQGCKMLPLIGEQCDDQGTTGEATSCLLGVCDSTSRTCVLRKEAESCTRQEDCESQRCVEGKCGAVCEKSST